MNGSDANDVLIAGKITGCYGIKGWVKVKSYTEPMENLLSLGPWRLKRRGEYEDVVFDQGKRQGRGLVVHIAGVDDRTLAESYAGLDIVIGSDVLPRLEEGDYYWSELQGLQVRCLDAGELVLLGTVDYLIETGANDVLVVKACEGSIDDRERLIPYLPGNTVKRVDLSKAVIEVDWFLDEE